MGERCELKVWWVFVCSNLRTATVWASCGTTLCWQEQSRDEFSRTICSCLPVRCKRFGGQDRFHDSTAMCFLEWTGQMEHWARLSMTRRSCSWSQCSSKHLEVHAKKPVHLCDCCSPQKAWTEIKVIYLPFHHFKRKGILPRKHSKHLSGEVE